MLRQVFIGLGRLTLGVGVATAIHSGEGEGADASGAEKYQDENDERAPPSPDYKMGKAVKHGLLPIWL